MIQKVFSGRLFNSWLASILFQSLGYCPLSGSTRVLFESLTTHQRRETCYAAFFPALSFAHLAGSAAAILFLPAAEIVPLRLGFGA
jgi:hypothetical protein